MHSVNIIAFLPDRRELSPQDVKNVWKKSYEWELCEYFHTIIHNEKISIVRALICTAVKIKSYR